MRRNLMGPIGAASILFCGVASAQAAGNFGEAGSFVVSAERLTGLYFDRIDVETDGVQDIGPVDADGEIETSRTTFVFLGNDAETTAAGIPRLAFDFFVIPSLSLGGALMFTTRSQEDDSNYNVDLPGDPETSSTTETSETTFAIAPRVGYGSMFTDLLGLWARGGITYASNHEEVDVEDVDAFDNITTSHAETTIHHWSLSLDGMLVISPIGHFAFAVGPYLDIPLTGDAEIRSQTEGNQVARVDADVTALSFGLSAGLLGWL
jgi:hypothetical protein